MRASVRTGSPREQPVRRVSAATGRGKWLARRWCYYLGRCPCLFAGPAPGVGALSVESLDEAAVASASACSRSDTYCRAKAETRRATTATAVPPTAMADSNAGTFIATLSHACRIFGMGQMPCPCPEGPRPAASSRSSRVQHHALIPLSALARSCGKRVAWPTVPADGSPHLHSVPSDVGFVQASGLLGSSATS